MISCMASTLNTDNMFVQWLESELSSRNWSRSDLAREIGAHPAVITKVLNRESALGVDLAKRIAIALHVPQSVLFRHAGLIDDDEPIKVRQVEDEEGEISLEELKADQEELLAIYDQLDEDDRETLVALAKNMRERDRAKQNVERKPKAPVVRQGTAKDSGQGRAAAA